MKYKVAQNQKLGHMTLIRKVGVTGRPCPLLIVAQNRYLVLRYQIAYEVQSCLASKVSLYDTL